MHSPSKRKIYTGSARSGLPGITFDQSLTRAKFKSAKGAPFNRSLLQKDLLFLTDLYQEEGHAFDRKHEVKVECSITKGPVVYIGRIEIKGNVKTGDKVIRRELRLAEGDRYSPKKLRESLRGVRNTGYFKNADIRMNKDAG